MRSKVERILPYASGLLIVLTVIPLAMVEVPPMYVPLVVAAFAALTAAAIWTAIRSGTVDSSEYTGFVGRIAQQAKGARRTVLYDGNLGLYQQWYLELRLAEEMARCARYDLSLALIIVKLEKTSLLNMSTDAWQDDASQAAYTTARSVRAVDLTAALGPDEFAVCLVHCDEEGAEVARARLEEALSLYGPSTGVVVYPLERVENRDIIRLGRSRAASRLQKVA